MNLKYLAKLKEKLIAADDFATVMDYFMTEFGDHEEFMRKGNCVRNQVLEAILCEIGKEVFPAAAAVVLKHVRFVEIPAHHFTHGGLLVNDCMSTMFYFADVQMGMLAVAMSMTGPAKFVRFSGKLLAPNLVASDN
jgi:hypothetical protein